MSHASTSPSLRTVMFAMPPRFSEPRGSSPMRISRQRPDVDLAKAPGLSGARNNLFITSSYDGLISLVYSSALTSSL